MNREHSAPGRARRPQACPAIALGVILALAAALRFYRLTGQSLWNDEGTSVALAGRSLRQITLGAAADIHPPLYHYLLHYWMAVFGSGDAAARSLSAVLGVALVAMIYILGRRLFGRAAGLTAALVAAVSSYQVYYSQEARMYMLLTFLGAASMYLFFVAWLEEPGGASRRRNWAMVGWVLVTTLTVYTHYLAAAVVLAQNVAWLANIPPAIRGRKAGWAGLVRRALTWAAAQAVVGLLFLPWLRLTWDQLHRWPAVSEPFGLLTLLKRALPLFALGPTADPTGLGWLVAAVLGVALLGLLLPARRPRPGARPGARLLALVYWATPVALLYYLSRSRPVYHHKFLLQATPGLALLLGRGIAGLLPVQAEGVLQSIGERPEPQRTPRAQRGHEDAEGHSVSPSPSWVKSLVSASEGRQLWRTLARAGVTCLLALLVIGAGIPGLRNYYFDPRYARDDYRGIAEYIKASGRPGDVVLVNAPSQVETVTRYYQGPLPVVPLPLQRPPDKEETERQLAQVTAGAGRVYGIFWATDESDPQRIVEGWLDAHAYKALDAWYGNLRLVTYAMPSGADTAGIQHPLDTTLGEHIALQGYTLAAPEVAAGDILQLTLFWRATGDVSQRYKVFTHVIDDAGRVIGQRDAEPGGGASLTNAWTAGQEVTDRYGVPIPPGTPPGEYLVEVGMYGLDDGARLPVTLDGQPAGDRVILQKVQVVRPDSPPPVAALGMQTQRTLKAGDLQLLGFSFGRAGALDQGRVALHPGEVAELVLFWQAVRAPVSDGQAVVRIVDGRGHVWLERAAPPVDGRYPLQEWQAEEIVRDSWLLALPGDLPAGKYRVLVGWQDSATESAPTPSELLAFVVE